MVDPGAPTTFPGAENYTVPATAIANYEAEHTPRGSFNLSSALSMDNPFAHGTYEDTLKNFPTAIDWEVTNGRMEAARASDVYKFVNKQVANSLPPSKYSQLDPTTTATPTTPATSPTTPGPGGTVTTPAPPGGLPTAPGGGGAQLDIGSVISGFHQRLNDAISRNDPKAIEAARKQFTEDLNKAQASFTDALRGSVGAGTQRTAIQDTAPAAPTASPQPDIRSMIAQIRGLPGMNTGLAGTVNGPQPASQPGSRVSLDGIAAAVRNASGAAPDSRRRLLKLPGLRIGG